MNNTHQETDPHTRTEDTQNRGSTGSESPRGNMNDTTDGMNGQDNMGQGQDDTNVDTGMDNTETGNSNSM